MIDKAGRTLCEICERVAVGPDRPICTTCNPAGPDGLSLLDRAALAFYAKITDRPASLEDGLEAYHKASALVLARSIRLGLHRSIRDARHKEG